LQTVNGIGPIFALAILLETDDMQRFPTVGHVASSCRCVDSQHLSNVKRNGAGNTYRSWAFLEAAHFAIRYEAVIRNFYQRKQARPHPLVALKAAAPKLARACITPCVSRFRSICTVHLARLPGLGVGLGARQGVGDHPALPIGLSSHPAYRPRQRCGD